MTHFSVLNVASCCFGVSAIVLCLIARRRLRNTTFAAPCLWAAASLTTATADVLWRCFSSAAFSGAHLDYLAAITTVAPFVALLGAKRPQDRAWQWIVAALVGLLAFQDLRTWSVDLTASTSVHAAWQWLLAGLIVVQWLNYLPTRHAVSACLALSGQAILLSGNLPFLPEPSSWSFPCGLLLLSLAVFGAAIETRSRGAADSWQTAWLDFRNLYGVLWSLRVAERVNSLAREQRSSLRLTWYGFEPAEPSASSPSPSPETPAADPFERALRSVLARFVSTDWLERRLASS